MDESQVHISYQTKANCIASLNTTSQYTKVWEPTQRGTRPFLHQTKAREPS